MTGAIYYPPADRTSQWYGPGNAIVAPTTVCWHSTETAGGWPGYSGGGDAPNFTYDPWTHRWRQHFQVNGSARALLNGNNGAYMTNRMGVVQIEVSCYCDPAQFGTGKGIDRLDAQAYDDMAAFAVFMRDEWGAPLSVGVASKPYPSSYGAGNGVRLSAAAFTAYAGHLMHQHVPYNDHGDAGALDLQRIVSGAPPAPTPATPTTVQEDFMATMTDQEKAKLMAAVDRIMGGIPAGSAVGRKDAAGADARLLDTGDGGAIVNVIHAASDPAAIAAAIPASIAQQVVDALGAKLVK